jgi:hypothetical protein
MKNLLITLFLLLPILAFGQSIQRNNFSTNANPAALGVATNVVLGLTIPVSALGNAAAPLTMTNAVVTSWSTNTLTVTASGVTNNSTTNNFLVSVTAGTGLAVKNSAGNQFLTPVLNNTFPLKPGQRFTGTAVTAIAVQDP